MLKHARHVSREHVTYALLCWLPVHAHNAPWYRVTIAGLNPDSLYQSLPWKYRSAIHLLTDEERRFRDRYLDPLQLGNYLLIFQSLPEVCCGIGASIGLMLLLLWCDVCSCDSRPAVAMS